MKNDKCGGAVAELLILNQAVTVVSDQLPDWYQPHKYRGSQKCQMAFVKNLG